MKARAFALFCLLAVARTAASFEPATPDATLFRVFLKDGTTLVSYGEIALVDDRVIFSMPVSIIPGSATATATLTAVTDPELQLVNIAADRVDLTRTASYAESARAAHYLSTRAFDDYAGLSNEVARALNEVAQTQDPVRRLAIVEGARKKLSEWPAAHYNFNQSEVQQLLMFLDEAIADLRASTGASRFSLNLVAAEAPAQLFEPLLPLPTLKETIEQVLTAARLADSPVERTSLLSTALAGIERDFGEFPADWAASTAARLRKEIEGEVQADRAYTLLTETQLAAAAKAARAADVRGIERLLNGIQERDHALGARRPDVVNALLASVREQLDAAQRLQLARDHWAVRVPAFRRYRTLLRTTLERFDQLKPSLEDIKALAGSPQSTLASVERLTRQILLAASRIKPPEELKSAHALFVSAAQLAGSAARIRREAAETADMARARDASSAASGALMLSAQARTEMQTLLRLPQLAP